MKTHNKFITLLLLIVFISGSVFSVETTGRLLLEPKIGLTTEQYEDPSELEHVTILKDTNNKVIFRVEIPWQEMNLTKMSLYESTYTVVDFNGWVKTMGSGLPQLPYLTVQLGVPFGSEISLEVKPGIAHEYHLTDPILPSTAMQMESWDLNAGIEVLNAPTIQTILEPDPSVYLQNKLYPEQIGPVGSDGWLRQQRVVGINIFPIQLRPLENTLIIYESLEVEVVLQEMKSSTHLIPKLEADVYEQLLSRTLLDYETSKQWRTTNPITNTTTTKFGLQAVESWIPPWPAWRIKTNSEGIYKLTYSELEMAGLPVSEFDPRTIQVFNQGVEIAIEVQSEVDGKFDENDYLSFYATSIDTKYTSENVYWLTYGDIEHGLRIGPVTGAPTGANIASNFTKTERIENNLHYVSKIPSDDRLDRWVGEVLAATPLKPASSSYTFDLIAPVQTGSSLKFALAGYSDWQINPDHHLVIRLNDQKIGDYWFDGLNYVIFEMQIPENLLLAGINTLEVHAPGDTGAASDQFFWIGLS